MGCHISERIRVTSIQTTRDVVGCVATWSNMTQRHRGDDTDKPQIGLGNEVTRTLCAASVSNGVDEWSRANRGPSPYYALSLPLRDNINPRGWSKQICAVTAAFMGYHPVHRRYQLMVTSIHRVDVTRSISTFVSHSVTALHYQVGHRPPR